MIPTASSSSPGFQAPSFLRCYSPFIPRTFSIPPFHPPIILTLLLHLPMTSPSPLQTRENAVMTTTQEQEGRKQGQTWNYKVPGDKTVIMARGGGVTRCAALFCLCPCGKRGHSHTREREATTYFSYSTLKLRLFKLSSSLQSLFALQFNLLFALCLFYRSFVCFHSIIRQSNVVPFTITFLKQHTRSFGFLLIFFYFPLVKHNTVIVNVCFPTEYNL